MGRLILFIIIIGAILAGIWFYVPGGDDMLKGLMGKSAPVEDSAGSDEAAGGDMSGGGDMGGSDATGDMGGSDMGGSDMGGETEGETTPDESGGSTEPPTR
jgi:hypothetical protein